MSVLEELENACEYPKFFWEDRDTDRVLAGYGANYTLSELPKSPSDFLFGGSCFSKSSKDTVWQDVPSSFFFNPRVLLRSSKQKQVLPSPFEFNQRVDTPTKDEWMSLVYHALSQIERKHLEKVVLARRTSLLFKDPLNPLAVLKNLQAKNNRAVCFLLQFSKDIAFIGATPEKLYSRQGQRLMTEALAGTCSLSEKDSLLKRPKEQLEFLIVKQFIHAHLAPLCQKIQWQEHDQVIRTSTVQHLYNQADVSLKPGISDDHLISLLHPTPAIAGSPKLAALSYLHQQEPFDRGWYCSPIGWIEKESSDIAIGIRSCLIRGHEMHLFAGAGIVKDSNPDKEWEELNHKISQFIGSES